METRGEWHVAEGLYPSAVNRKVLLGRLKPFLHINCMSILKAQIIHEASVAMAERGMDIF